MKKLPTLLVSASLVVSLNGYSAAAREKDLIVVRVRPSARGTARATVTIMNKRRLVPMQKVLMTPMRTGKRNSTSMFKTTRHLRRRYKACCRRGQPEDSRSWIQE